MEPENWNTVGWGEKGPKDKESDHADEFHLEDKLLGGGTTDILQNQCQIYTSREKASGPLSAPLPGPKSASFCVHLKLRCVNDKIIGRSAFPDWGSLLNGFNWDLDYVKANLNLYVSFRGRISILGASLRVSALNRFLRTKKFFPAFAGCCLLKDNECSNVVYIYSVQYNHKGTRKRRNWNYWPPWSSLRTCANQNISLWVIYQALTYWCRLKDPNISFGYIWLFDREQRRLYEM